MRSIGALWATASLALVAGCGGTDPGLFGIPAAKGGGAGAAGAQAPVCTKGATQVCVGPGACKGGQSCLDNGSGWTSCDCGAAGTGNGGKAGSPSGGTGGTSTAGSAGAGGTSDPGGMGGVGGAGGEGGAGGAGGDAGMAGSSTAGTGGTAQAGAAGQGGVAGSGGGAAGAAGAPLLSLWSDGFPCASSLPRFVAADPIGDVFIAGTLTGTCTLGATTLSAGAGTAITLVKLDAAGFLLWAKAYGDGTSNDDVGGLAIDAAGNVALAGSLEGALDFGKGPMTSVGNRDIFLAKFDNEGNLSWNQSFGDTASDFGDGVAFDAQGNVLLIGRHAGKADFGNGPLDGGTTPSLFAAKFDPLGAYIWAEGFYGLGTSPLGIAAKPDGHVVLAGGFRSDVTFGGGPVLVAQAPGSGNADLFVAELDGDGKHVWSRAFGDADGNQAATALALTSNGGVVVTGTFNGTLDFTTKALKSPGFSSAAFAASFSSSGTYQWSLGWGGTDTTFAGGVAIGPADVAFLVGSFTGTVALGGPTLTAPAGMSASYFARIDATGGYLDSRSWDASEAKCVSVAPGGPALIGGVYSTSLDFGQGPLPFSMGSSTYVVELAP